MNVLFSTECQKHYYEIGKIDINEPNPLFYSTLSLALGVGIRW